MSLTNPSVSNFNFMQLSQVPNKTISDKLVLLHISADHNKSLPAAHHEEVCDYQSSVGSFRSQYITISSSFTDAFWPSSLHSTINRRALRLLCCRKCLIAGMFPNETIIAASQCLSKSKMLSSRFSIGSSSSCFQSFLRTSTLLPN